MSMPAFCSSFVLRVRSRRCVSGRGFGTNAWDGQRLAYGYGLGDAGAMGAAFATPAPLQPNSVVRILFDYMGTEWGVLSLRAGDVATVLEFKDEGWCILKTTAGQEGYFPQSYVRPAGAISAAPRRGGAAPSGTMRCEVHGKNRLATVLKEEPNPLTGGATMRWVCKPGCECKGASSVGPPSAAQQASHAQMLQAAQAAGAEHMAKHASRQTTADGSREWALPGCSAVAPRRDLGAAPQRHAPANAGTTAAKAANPVRPDFAVPALPSHAQLAQAARSKLPAVPAFDSSGQVVGAALASAPPRPLAAPLPLPAQVKVEKREDDSDEDEPLAAVLARRAPPRAAEDARGQVKHEHRKEAHVIFVVDISASMNTRDGRNGRGGKISRMEVVKESCLDFVRTHLRQEATPGVQDLYSLVFFNDSAHVAVRRQRL